MLGGRHIKAWSALGATHIQYYRTLLTLVVLEHGISQGHIDEIYVPVVRDLDAETDRFSHA